MSSHLVSRWSWTAREDRTYTSEPPPGAATWTMSTIIVIRETKTSVAHNTISEIVVFWGGGGAHLRVKKYFDHVSPFAIIGELEVQFPELTVHKNHPAKKKSWSSKFFFALKCQNPRLFFILFYFFIIIFFFFFLFVCIECMACKSIWMCFINIVGSLVFSVHFCNSWTAFLSPQRRNWAKFHQHRNFCNGTFFGKGTSQNSLWWPKIIQRCCFNLFAARRKRSWSVEQYAGAWDLFRWFWCMRSDNQSTR